MRVDKAIKEAVLTLKNVQIASFNLDAKILMAHVLKISIQDLILNHQQSELTIENYQKYKDLINFRCKKIPISHLIEQREFYNNVFMVNNFVLDPRPDSETLIELIINKFPLNSSINLCEIGCGSGCLIITLLKNFKNWKGTAIDISSNALEVAKINAKTHEVLDKIHFINSNIFSQISPHNQFDLIISNPPYIPTNDIENLQDEVRLYEPRLALDGGIDGLNFYREIADNSSKFLTENGQIFVEIGYNQFDEVQNIFFKKNYYLSDYKRDLNGHIRSLHFSI
jgi:release factor glutamine methyltransferase